MSLVALLTPAIRIAAVGLASLLALEALHEIFCDATMIVPGGSSTCWLAPATSPILGSPASLIWSEPSRYWAPTFRFAPARGPKPSSVPNLAVRHNTRRYGRPSCRSPGPIGVGRCGPSRRRELRLNGVLRSSPVGSPQTFAWFRFQRVYRNSGSGYETEP